MKSLIKSATLAAAAAGAAMAFGAAPAIAAPAFHTPVVAGVETGAAASAENWRERRGYNRNYSRDRRYYSNRHAYRDNRTWRGRDGRYYCRRDNGTTGLVVGGAVGGVMGHEIAGRGDRTLGTILGVAGGALLGREIDRGGGRRCR